MNLSHGQTGPTKKQTINELNNQQWEAAYKSYYDDRKGDYQVIGKQDQKDNYIRSKTFFVMKDNSCVLEVTINYQEAENPNTVKNAAIQTKTIEIDMNKVIRIESHFKIVMHLWGMIRRV